MDVDEDSSAVNIKKQSSSKEQSTSQTLLFENRNLVTYAGDTNRTLKSTGDVVATAAVISNNRATGVVDQEKMLQPSVAISLLKLLWCEVCKEKFSDPDGLDKHIESRHCDIPLKKKARCGKCLKRSKCGRTLLAHGKSCWSSFSVSEQGEVAFPEAAKKATRTKIHAEKLPSKDSRSSFGISEPGDVVFPEAAKKPRKTKTPAENAPSVEKAPSTETPPSKDSQPVQFVQPNLLVNITEEGDITIVKVPTSKRQRRKMKTPAKKTHADNKTEETPPTENQPNDDSGEEIATPSERLGEKKPKKRPRPKYVHCSIPHFQEHLCEICSKILTSRGSYLNHMRMHTDERPYACQYCPKHFRTTNSKRVHYLRMHAPVRPYACHLCTMTFPRKAEMEMHLQKHEGLRKFICDQCSLGFNTDFDRHRHVLNVHCSKKHFCDVCTASFKQPHHLRRHKMLHSGDKPFQCPVCPDRWFTQKGNLKIHMTTHERHTPREVHSFGERSSDSGGPYKCPVCPDRVFNQSGNLRIHMNLVHAQPLSL